MERRLRRTKTHDEIERSDVTTGLEPERQRIERVSEPAVEAGGLACLRVSKRYGSVQALADCSLSVGRGRMLGFLGPNGAGKTTAMRAVFGLVRLDAGELLWDGRPVGPAERLRFGYMPEERGLYPRMRVGEQLAYLGCLHGLDASTARRAASRWLERLGLAERAGAKVEELSHGNQQRAQLAAALLHEPDLLVLDEPFAGLDPVAVRTLAAVLRDEAARGAAVLFSSHQLELVEDICEDVAIIDHGRVIAIGDVEELCRSSRRRRIELHVEGAPSGWLPEVDDLDLVERRDGQLRLLAGSEVDPALVLAAAERAARVVGFSYGPPSLAELFLELVAR
jgi:ABC-2 type transport system ATP-binding protein